MARKKGRPLPRLELSLTDLKLTDSDMVKLTERTHRKIIWAFEGAQESDPRKYVKYEGTRRRQWRQRSTGNAILDCPGLVREVDGQEPVVEVDLLASRIIMLLRGSAMKMSILSIDYVHASVRKKYSAAELEAALSKLEHAFVAELLKVMTTEAGGWVVSYHETEQTWQVSQSAVDASHMWRRMRARISTKKDVRTYHGRPRKQTRDRGIPEGTSVGLPKETRAYMRRQDRHRSRQETARLVGRVA